MLDRHRRGAPVHGSCSTTRSGYIVGPYGGRQVRATLAPTLVPLLRRPAWPAFMISSSTQPDGLFETHVDEQQSLRSCRASAKQRVAIDTHPVQRPENHALRRHRPTALDTHTERDDTGLAGRGRRPIALARIHDFVMAHRLSTAGQTPTKSASALLRTLSGRRERSASPSPRTAPQGRRIRRHVASPARRLPQALDTHTEREIRGLAGRGTRPIPARTLMIAHQGWRNRGRRRRNPNSRGRPTSSERGSRCRPVLSSSTALGRRHPWRRQLEAAQSIETALGARASPIVILLAFAGDCRIPLIPVRRNRNHAIHDSMTYPTAEGSHTVPIVLSLVDRCLATGADDGLGESSRTELQRLLNRSRRPRSQTRSYFMP